MLPGAPPPSAPSSPGGMPGGGPVGAGGPPGQPPMGGAGGASMPAPNQGNLSGGIAFIVQSIKALERALPMVGSESEVGQAVMKAITSLSKVAQPAQASPGVEQNALGQLMAQQKQDQPMVQALRAQGAAGGQPPAAKAA